MAFLDSSNVEDLVADIKALADGTYSPLQKHYTSLSKLLGDAHDAGAFIPIVFSANSDLAQTFSGTSSSGIGIIKWMSGYTRYDFVVFQPNLPLITLGTVNETTSVITVNAQYEDVISVSQGGTGLTSSPSLLVNLASTTAADVFTAAPRAGVTGTLPIGHGGTGATNADDARDNLGLGNLKANFNTSINSGASKTINIPNSARGVLIAISVTAAQHLVYTVATTSSGAVRTGKVLDATSGVTVTTGTGTITIANSGSYTLYAYWLSLSGDDVTVSS